MDSITNYGVTIICGCTFEFFENGLEKCQSLTRLEIVLKISVRN